LRFFALPSEQKPPPPDDRHRRAPAASGRKPNKPLRDQGALARAGVTFVPDDGGVFPCLTIGENIRLILVDQNPELAMRVCDRVM
jgi:hypothetical protein